ncbi:MAG: riboflavin synthase, partial [Thermoguttaceae bacterium]|nr:riboflavin synthase [Thermoguttaceae bacterium]
KSGSPVNLELALKVDSRLGGHFVSGHIDGQAVLEKVDDMGDWQDYYFRVPKELARQMASKGSVAVDGVSLTLVRCEPELFSVALIPYTLKVTTLGRKKVGDRVNIETDILAKYVQRLVEAQEWE